MGIGKQCPFANIENVYIILEELQKIEIQQSIFKKVATANGQLKHLGDEGERSEIVDLYRNGSWNALEKKYQNKIGLRKYASQIKAVI